MTIVEFLNARLDEDDAVAHEADEAGEWFARTNPRTNAVYGTEARDPVAEAISFRVAPHIARFDPSRMLYEIDAERAIIEMHTGPHECPSAEDNCGWWDNKPCPTLVVMASTYRDHPDFDSAWVSPQVSTPRG